MPGAVHVCTPVQSTWSRSPGLTHPSPSCHVPLGGGTPLPSQQDWSPPYLCGTGWPGRRRQHREAGPGRQRQRRVPAPAGCARPGGSAAALAPSETPPGWEQDLPSHHGGTKPRCCPFPPLPLPGACLSCRTWWESGHPSGGGRGTSPCELAAGAGAPPQPQGRTVAWAHSLPHFGCLPAHPWGQPGLAWLPALLLLPTRLRAGSG